MARRDGSDGGKDNAVATLTAAFWSLALGVKVDAGDVPALIRLQREARRVVALRRTHGRDPASPRTVLDDAPVDLSRLTSEGRAQLLADALGRVASRASGALRCGHAGAGHCEICGERSQSCLVGAIQACPFFVPRVVGVP